MSAQNYGTDSQQVAFKQSRPGLRCGLFLQTLESLLKGNMSKQLSVIQRKMVPQIIAMGWFGKPHIVMPFEREIQKVNQTWRSFGMSTAAWLEKRTRWGLDIKMPFERDAQKPAKSGINIQWSTFGMAVTFL